MPENNKARSTLLIAMLLVTGTGLVACRQEKPKAPVAANKKIDPLALESELRILALKGRVESGKNNPAFDWVTPFETASGCKVKATLADDDAALLSKLEGKPFDLVITSQTLLPVLELQAIETSRLRSIGRLDQRFAFDSGNKQIQALPFQWQLLQAAAPSAEAITKIEYTHMPAKAEHPNCAYAWMEWTLSPKVQADIASALGTIPVVPAACIGNELLGDDACRKRMGESVERVSDEVPVAKTTEAASKSRTP